MLSTPNEVCFWCRLVTARAISLAAPLAGMVGLESAYLSSQMFHIKVLDLCNRESCQRSAVERLTKTEPVGWQWSVHTEPSLRTCWPRAVVQHYSWNPPSFALDAGSSFNGHGCILSRRFLSGGGICARILCRLRSGAGVGQRAAGMAIALHYRRQPSRAAFLLPRDGCCHSVSTHTEQR